MARIETTCSECGATFLYLSDGVGQRNFCGKACLGKYRTKHLTGEKAANWKGGRSANRGRVMVFKPDHPNAQSNGYVYRYRLVAEATLGRPLSADEVVHHIDDDETNDEPSNLLVMTQAEHASRRTARRRGGKDHAAV
jgi:hypothetical protein